MVVEYPDGSSGGDLERYSDRPDQGLGGVAYSPDTIFPEVALVRVAQAIRELRKVRREQFGLELDEPAWDMVIELYYQDSTGASTTTAQLRDVSNVPPSTADRWLKFLEREMWIATRDHPTDAGIRFVDLTKKTREAMEGYLREVHSFALKQPRS